MHGRGCKERGYSTTTHPYGNLITQRDERFGFIRISKNASSSVASVSGFKFSKWKKITEFKGRKYAAIRNPIVRFASSIPETLLRINSIDPVNGNMPDDVVVPYDLLEDIYSLPADSVEKFVDSYIGMVKHKFFDAHHEPQVMFVTNRNGEYYNDLSFFSVDNLDGSLNEIARREGVNVKKLGKNNVRAGGVKKNRLIRSAYHSALRIIKKQPQRSFDIRNPLVRLYKNEGVGAPQAAIMLRRHVEEYLAGSEIIKDLVEMYAEDVELYNKVKNDFLVSADSL